MEYNSTHTALSCPETQGVRRERERERKREKREPWQGVIDGGVGPPEAKMEITVTTSSSRLKWACQWPTKLLICFAHVCQGVDNSKTFVDPSVLVGIKIMGPSAGFKRKGECVGFTLTHTEES